MSKKNINCGENRLEWLDCLKGFGIMIVVLGHIFPTDEPLGIYIQAFHMPFFFILTGMLHSINEGWKNHDFKLFVIKRLKNLMWPYITFSILVFFYYLIWFNKSELMEVIKDTLSLNGYKTLWFLPSLFFAEIIFYLLNKIKKVKAIVQFIFLILVIICLQNIMWRMADTTGIIFYIYKYVNMLSRAVIGTTYIYIGYYLERVYKIVRDKEPKINDLLIIVIAVIMGIIGVIISQVNGFVNLHTSLLNNIVFYYLSAILNSIFYIIIFRMVIKEQSLLGYFGRNSIIIMVTHYCIPITTLVGQVVEYCAFSNNSYVNLFYVWLITLIIEFFVVVIINKWFKAMVKY